MWLIERKENILRHSLEPLGPSVTHISIDTTSSRYNYKNEFKRKQVVIQSSWFWCDSYFFAQTLWVYLVRHSDVLKIKPSRIMKYFHWVSFVYTCPLYWKISLYLVKCLFCLLSNKNKLLGSYQVGVYGVLIIFQNRVY